MYHGTEAQIQERVLEQLVGEIVILFKPDTINIPDTIHTQSITMGTNMILCF